VFPDFGLRVGLQSTALETVSPPDLLIKAIFREHSSAWKKSK
jgi:hypothetical protein